MPLCDYVVNKTNIKGPIYDLNRKNNNNKKKKKKKKNKQTHMLSLYSWKFQTDIEHAKLEWISYRNEPQSGFNVILIHLDLGILRLVAVWKFSDDCNT